jgi:hypothetical protein
MIGLLNERRGGNFGLLRLSKAFKFPTQQTISNAFDMPIPFETAAGAWSLTLKPREVRLHGFHEQHLRWPTRCDAGVGL